MNAPIQKCFDLARDMDAHKLSAAKTKEIAIAGRTTGLCELGDTITWEATHFGIRQRLSVEITKMDIPHFFEDRMTKGAFKSMRHEHHFKSQAGKTIITDRFYYEIPFGFIGKLFDKILLKKHMTAFLKTRNHTLRQLADLP